MEVLSLMVDSQNWLVAAARFGISNKVLAVERKQGIGVVSMCHCSRLSMHCWIIIGIHVHVQT